MSNLARSSSPGFDVYPNNFDLVRLAAALQVVYFHGIKHLQIEPVGVGSLISEILSYFPGVQMFFVISGFLISMSWERNSDLRSYTRNRFLRIYPALWLAFLAALGLAIVTGHVDLARVATPSFWIWVVSQTTVLQLYNPPFLRDLGVGAINGALWTIPVEISFYVFLPILYWLVIDRFSRRRADVTLIALGLVSFSIYYLGLFGPWGRDEPLLRLMRFTLVGHLFMFLAGVLWQRHLGRITGWLENRFALLVSFYVVFKLTTTDVDPSGAVGYLLILTSRMLLAAVTISAAFSLRGLSSRVLGRTDVSYGVYLFHVLVINLFVEYGWTGDVSYLVLIFAIVLVIAWLSWTFVEHPALRLKRRSIHP